MGSVSDGTPPTKIAIIGCSYAGLSAAVNLLDISRGISPRMEREPYVHLPDLAQIKIEITIIDERDGFYHLIGSPLALADFNYANKAWVKFKDIPTIQAPNVHFRQGSVSDVDCESKVLTIIDHTTQVVSSCKYDYLVVASGLRRVWPVVPQSFGKMQYLLEAKEHIHAVSRSRHGVVVVGGGAVGIEMAAELKLVQPGVKVTLVHSRDKLLSSEALSDECKELALELLKEAKVDVLMEHRLSSTKEMDSSDGTSQLELEFTNGHKMVASLVIMAISKSVSTASYLPKSSLDADNSVKILSNLSFAPGTPNARYHFCAGDVAKWSGIKRCGGAMHMGTYVAHNIYQTMLKEFTGQDPVYLELEEFPPVIGLAVGKKALASGPDGTVSGEDVMKTYFEGDLGFGICWNHMQLGGHKTAVEA